MYTSPILSLTRKLMTALVVSHAFMHAATIQSTKSWVEIAKAQAEKHQTSTSKFSPKLQKWSKKRKKLWKFHEASKLLRVFFTLRLFQFPPSR